MSWPYLGRCEAIVKHNPQCRPHNFANQAASVLHHLDLQEGCKPDGGYPLLNKVQGVPGPWPEILLKCHQRTLELCSHLGPQKGGKQAR